MVNRPKLAVLSVVGLTLTSISFEFPLYSNYFQIPQLSANAQVTSINANWNNPRVVHLLNHKLTDFESRNRSMGVSSYPVTISSDSQTLITAGIHSVRLWNLITGEEIASPLELNQGSSGWAAQSIALSPNGQRLVVASDFSAQFQSDASGSSSRISADIGTVDFWNISDRAYAGSDPGATSLGSQQVLWGDAGLVVYGHCSDTDLPCVLFYNGSGSDPLKIPLYSFRSDQFFAVHQTDRILASVSGKSGSFGVDFVDLQDGKDLGRLRIDRLNGSSSENSSDASLSSIFSTITAQKTITFSSDGSLLAISRENNVVYLVATANLRQKILEGEGFSIIKINPEYESAIVFMAISPDNKVLATASEEEPVKLWDIRTGVLIATLDQAASNLAFSSDGQYLVTSSRDGTITVLSPR